MFKDAEKRAMPLMEKKRDEAQKRGREERTGQTELVLFSNMLTQDPSAYFISLRDRYTSRAGDAVLHLIQTKRHLLYDEVWAAALSFPLTWESDLKDWLSEWERRECLEFTGMKESQRVPQRGQNIRITWKG